VQWLLDNVAVDGCWILVHATHLDDREVAAAAASGAVVAVCPVTEATLGDGLFPLVEYHRNRGAWGIGTDSHYTTSPAEELRILEIMKRLQLGRRNILADSSDRLYSHTGRQLFDLAVAGGNQGLAQNTGSLVPGRRADLVVLDAESPTTITHGTDTILDAWLLSCTCNPVRDVMIAGRWVVRDGTHVREREILDGYTKSMGRLVSTS
jgi:formimidoylglutamate deiminase